MPTWSSLDPSARMVAGAGIALAALAIVGAIVGAWQGSNFMIILLVCGLGAAGLAWAGTMPSLRSLPVPLPTVELAAGLVAAVVTVWNLIEMLADLDQLDERGDAPGAIITVLVAIAAIALLVAASRRDLATLAAAKAADRPTRLVVGGFGLALLGWALNLTVGYFTMAQAALSLVLITLATVITIAAPRLKIGFPAAWVGAGIGVVGLLIALGLWGDLMRLGASRVQLEPVHIVAFLLAGLGVIAIVAGGVLAGLAVRTALPTRPTTPTSDVPPATPPGS